MVWLSFWLAARKLFKSGRNWFARQEAGVNSTNWAGPRGLAALGLG